MEMRVVLVGHDFDFSAGDAISRYSYEIYRGIKKHAEVRTIATGRLPRPVRALFSVKVKDADIVHLMYPNVARVEKGGAKMVVMWHDLRVFSKYLEQSQYRTKPKITERLNIAGSVIRRWTRENIDNTDATLYNSSQTRRELQNHLSASGQNNAGKPYAITLLGVDPAFLRAKVWRGVRRDFAYTGSIQFRHKNLHGLLRVFSEITSKSDARLHIFTSTPDAKALLGEEIRHFSNLSERNVVLHLRPSYQEIARRLPRLAAYLQLTKHEGLGLPILEALAAGTNVLTLKDSVIPAETRKYAFSGTETEVTRKAMELAKHPRPASAQAIKYARSFTWESTVRKTLAVYKQVLMR